MAQIALLGLTTMAAALQGPMGDPPAGQGAPQAPANARYCLRVEPITGTRIETIQCRTREDWASLEVDVDREWAQNGVRVINA